MTKFEIRQNKYGVYYICDEHGKEQYCQFEILACTDKKHIEKCLKLLQENKLDEYFTKEKEKRRSIDKSYYKGTDVKVVKYRG